MILGEFMAGASTFCLQSREPANFQVQNCLASAFGSHLALKALLAKQPHALPAAQVQVVLITALQACNVLGLRLRAQHALPGLVVHHASLSKRIASLHAMCR